MNKQPTHLDAYNDGKKAEQERILKIIDKVIDLDNIKLYNKDKKGLGYNKDSVYHSFEDIREQIIKGIKEEQGK